MDHKYRSEDVGAKKFVVGQFLDYKIVDSKTMLSQVEEIHMIFNKICNKGYIVEHGNGSKNSKKDKQKLGPK